MITVKKGDQVFIKPQFQDKGDDMFKWVAIEDEDGDKVKVSCHAGMSFNPVYVINTYKLKTSPVIPTLGETIQRMKNEIIEHAKAGIIRPDIQSFSELHDLVDANEYGGFCEDELHQALSDHFRMDSDGEGMPEYMVDYTNKAQNLIDEWLSEDGLKKALQQHIRLDLLKPFSVSLHEDAGDKSQIIFECLAVDADNAYDQAYDAYPNGEMLNAVEMGMSEFDRVFEHTKADSPSPGLPTPKIRG